MTKTKRKKDRDADTPKAADLFQDPDFVKRYEARRRRFTDDSEKLVRAIRASERLSEDDFAIRMNAR